MVGIIGDNFRILSPCPFSWLHLIHRCCPFSPHSARLGAAATCDLAPSWPRQSRAFPYSEFRSIHSVGFPVIVSARYLLHSHSLSFALRPIWGAQRAVAVSFPDDEVPSELLQAPGAPARTLAGHCPNLPPHDQTDADALAFRISAVTFSHSLCSGASSPENQSCRLFWLPVTSAPPFFSPLEF